MTNLRIILGVTMGFSFPLLFVSVALVFSTAEGYSDDSTKLLVWCAAVLGVAVGVTSCLIYIQGRR